MSYDPQKQIREFTSNIDAMEENAIEQVRTLFDALRRQAAAISEAIDDNARHFEAAKAVRDEATQKADRLACQNNEMRDLLRQSRPLSGMMR
jgi:ectoine hydroxylase-related dioxygenase (phytanoyl-CoA dioxygenase family)